MNGRADASNGAERRREPPAPGRRDSVDRDADSPGGQGAANPPDVVERRSGRDFAETVALLRAAIERAGLTVFATIDHAAAATDAGLAMPPTVVLIYGHARGGTPIMQAAPNAALDLPLRVLVREAADGVRVVYRRAAAMLEQAGVPDELAGRLDGAQRLIDLALESG